MSSEVKKNLPEYALWCVQSLVKISEKQNFFLNFFGVLPGSKMNIFAKGKLLPRTFSEMSKNWYHIVD